MRTSRLASSISAPLKQIVLISAVYSLAHGLMLFNVGVYWDDWIYYVTDFRTVLEFFSQAGLPYSGYFLGFFFSFGNGITVLRVLIFVSYLLCTLILNSLLSTVNEIDDNSRLALVLLFSVFPADTTWTILSDSLYAIYTLAFFAGAWLISQYLDRRIRVLRILALCMFFLSFTLNCFLFFDITVLLYILYREGALERVRLSFHEIARVVRIIPRYLDFVALPFVFWITRYFFFLPYGLYEGTNTIQPSDFLPWILATSLAKAFDYSVVDVFVRSIKLLAQPLFWPVGILSVLVISSLLFLILRSKAVALPMTSAPKMIIVGFILFGIGVFPFLAVGKVPAAFTLESRWAVLVPIGASFLVYYLLSAVVDWVRLPRRRLFKMVALSVLLGMLVTTNIMVNLEYQRDWYKQQSLVENLRSSDIIRTHKTFLVIDHASYMNVYSRSYRFYEFTSMMKYAFGDETRFACLADEWNYAPVYMQYKVYNFGNYTLGKPEYVINIYKGDYDVDSNLALLMYYEMTDPVMFQKLVRNVVTLRCESLSSGTNSSGPVPC